MSLSDWKSGCHLFASNISVWNSGYHLLFEVHQFLSNISVWNSWCRSFLFNISDWNSSPSICFQHLSLKFRMPFVSFQHLSLDIWITSFCVQHFSLAFRSCFLIGKPVARRTMHYLSFWNSNETVCLTWNRCMCFAAKLLSVCLCLFHHVGFVTCLLLVWCWKGWTSNWFFWVVFRTCALLPFFSPN